MNIGIQIEPQFGFSWPRLLDVARGADAAGFHALWLSDHLFLDGNSTSTDCLESWTALAALAPATSRIRLGTMVTCQSFRNPALLAKMSASVDAISGGRAELGLGTGWKELEYRAYGYEFPAAPVRIQQLAETIEICGRMWTEERATFSGRHYAVRDAICAPKPVHGRVPIWIGARRPGLFRLAARRADGLNWFPEGGFPTPAQVAAAMRELDAVCLSAGRDPATLRRSVFLGAVMGATQDEVDAVVHDLSGRVGAAPADWMRDRPGMIVGTPAAALERLRAYAAAGVDHANVRPAYGYERRTMELLGQVLAQL